MLARFYTASGDAQAQARCVVPARVLPAHVANPLFAEPRKGLPSLWQNPNKALIDALMTDVGCGNRIVVDVDDPYHTTHEHYDEAQARQHLVALGQADVLLVTNEALAESYQGLHPDIRIVPTCVDPLDWEPGRMTQHLDGKFRIGYAAGWSHKPDCALVASALARLSEHDEVQIEFMGGFDPEWDFPYVHYPVLPHPAYKAVIATWNVGVAPLVDNDMNRTRSDLKALDYAMCGTICVASPYGPFLPMVEQNVLAHAEGDEDWYETLLTILEDNSLRESLVTRAYQYCRVARHPANQRTAYLDALGLIRSRTRV